MIEVNHIDSGGYPGRASRVIRQAGLASPASFASARRSTGLWPGIAGLILSTLVIGYGTYLKGSVSAH